MTSYVLKNAIHTVVCETIQADIQSQTSDYYFFVGGLQLPGVNISTDADASYAYELNARNEIVAMKKVLSSDVSFVIPRINWTSGLVYDYYDDYTPSFPSNSGATDISTAQFYVMNSQFNVYKCLSNNVASPSLVEPTSTLAQAFTTSDGYRWKYMYAIPLSMRNRFLNSAYMPVQTALLDQFYSAGQVSSTVILAPGKNYVQSSTTIVIDGDGQGAILTPVVTGGQIVQIVITNPGTGYTYANLTVVGVGTGANIVANLSVGNLDTSQADVELLAVAGSLESFRMTANGAGYTATGVPQTGVADGVSTAYQLTDQNNTVAPLLTTTPTIYKTNWGGKQALYNTPRTNLLIDSQVFTAGWTATNMIVTSNAIAAPDGTITATKIADNADTASEFHNEAHGNVVGVSVSSPLTISIYAKAAERPYLLLRLIDNDSGQSGNYCFGGFDLSLGTCSANTAGVASGASASITNVGNGWYRCTLSGTPNPANSTGNQCSVLVASPLVSLSNTTSYVGASGHGIYLWGAQLETGTVATSYLLTTTAPVTRTDILSMTADGRVTFGWTPSTKDTMSWSGKYKQGTSTITVTNSIVCPQSSIVLPTVTITGDGTGATAHPVISNNQIVALVVDTPGQNYTTATVSISGNGLGATAIPVISPWGGHGKDAVSELYAQRLSFFSNLLNDTNQGLTIANQFRQIGIIRNPRQYGSDQFFTDVNASGLVLINFSGASPSADDVLTEQNTGSRFRVIQVTGTQLVAQNLDNFALQGNSVLLNTNSGTQVGAVTVVNPQVDKFSGDLLFIDNFAINQQSSQQLIIFKTTLKF